MEPPTDLSLEYGLEIAHSKKLFNRSKTLLIENNRKMKELVTETIRRNEELISKELEEYNKNMAMSISKLERMNRKQKEIEMEIEEGLFFKQAEFYHKTREMLSEKIKKLEPVIITKIDEMIINELSSDSFRKKLNEEIIKRKLSVYDSMNRYKENIRKTYYEFKETHDMMIKDMKEPEFFSSIVENVVLGEENEKLFVENIKLKKKIETIEIKLIEEEQKNLETTIQNEDSLWEIFGEEINTLFNVTTMPVSKKKQLKKKKSKKHKSRKVRPWQLKANSKKIELKLEPVDHTELKMANQEIDTLKDLVKKMSMEIRQQQDYLRELEQSKEDHADYYTNDSEDTDSDYEDVMNYLREKILYERTPTIKRG